MHNYVSYVVFWGPKVRVRIANGLDGGTPS